MTNLTEIKARLAAATDGPWEVGLDDNNDSVYSPGIRQRRGQANTDLVAICYRPEKKANAKLIAHAPTDIATLIKALEAAEKKQHEIWGALKTQTKELARAYAKIESLKASE